MSCAFLMFLPTIHWRIAGRETRLDNLQPKE